MKSSRARTLSRWCWTSLPLLAALFLPATAHAQDGSITGTVTSASTGDAIADVPIFIVRSDDLSETGVVFAGSTDASGVYSFTGEAGGYYVAAVPSEEGLDFVDEIYGGIRAPIDFPDLVDGTLVTITPGNTTTVNFALLAGGHVTGTVTDAATGAPLANVLVQSTYRYNNGDYWLTDAMTDAAGHYDIGGLPPGEVFLVTRSFNVPGYVDEYWDNSPCVGPCPDSRTQLPAPTPTTIVSGATVAGRDFALDPGGVLSGRITNAAGQPIPNLSVNVNALVNNALRSMGSVSTNADGVYRMSGLATGTYFAFTGVGNSGYMNELYDNVLCPLGCNNIQSGTEIPVTVRNTTADRNFVLDTGGVITGTVTNAANGNPIQNVTVTAVTRVGGNLFTRLATTDASGVYRLAGLTAGTYWLYTSNTFTWVNEIFNDIPCVGVGCNSTSAAALGAPIAVARGATVANQDFALVDGGFLTGVVRDSVSATPISGQIVELRMQSGSGASFLTSMRTGPDGYFSFGGLTTGTYVLNTAGRTGHQNEIYNNIPCGASVCSNFGAATPIPITLGSPVNGRDFDLDPVAGGLRGKITSSATGLPLAGVSVSLYQRVGSGVFVASTVTNGRGNYFFDSLPAGTYVVFTSNSLGYRNEIYNDIPCPGACSASTAASTGAAIDVTNTAWTSGIDFALDERTSAPAAPTNFRVVMTGTTAVFSWTAPGSNTTGAAVSYVIDAGFSPGTTAISLPAGSGTSFTIPGVPPGAFYVRVRAINTFGSSPPSNEVTLGMSVAGVALPDAPTNVQAFMQDGLLTMTWLQPPRGGPATGYVVEAGSASGLTNIGRVAVSGRSLTFPNVPQGFYVLRVRATNAGGTSAPSAEVMVVVGGVPAPPGAPSFTLHTVSGNTVTLTWAAPTSGTPTSYVVEAGSAPGLSNLAVANTGSAATTVAFSGVPPGTYYVRLRAANAQGASVVSNERTIIVQ
ncbi:MAG: carboxypeptidase regulatory-like domain-containing protein [Acidobacteria bacterium]|nr:carboxypeptidase regulatory-like domain-containing protein [Acidobacteriota bacterium]